MLEYSYVRFVLNLWEEGVSQLEWTNPRLAKMSVIVLSALYFRYASPFAEFVPPKLTKPLGFYGAVTFVLHGVMAISTWNYYFDAKGKATKFYCFDNENRPHFFAVQRTNRWTGEPLTPITPKEVADIEARRRAPFKEVKDPHEDDWFWRGNAKPRLWYCRRPDGIHVFNQPGFDTATGAELQPITTTVRESYHAERGRGGTSPQQSGNPPARNPEN